MLGRKPWRIDILNEIDGVSFAEAWKGRAYADFEGEKLPVIGLRELILNKRATGRHKDLLDVERLEFMASETAAIRKETGLRRLPRGTMSKAARGPARKSPRSPQKVSARTGIHHEGS
jgi:hypothetical protein